MAMAHQRPISRRSSKSSSMLSQKEDDGEAAFRSSHGSVKGIKRGDHSLDLNENSPLLSPTPFAGDGTYTDRDIPDRTLDYNDGDDEEKSKSVFYLFILTLGIGG